MHLPPKLYKYEAFNAQALQNLKAHGIYFGSPLGFNDPYDCATRPNVVRPSETEAELVRDHYLTKEKVPDAARAGFSNASVNTLQDMLQKSGREVIESTIERFLAEKGISCFSESNSDLLMWAHYGGKYKGFCLEFSTEFEPFSKAKRVQYHEKIPEASVLPFLLSNNVDGALDFFCIKPNSWSYEKEWRVFHKEAGTLYHYEAQALTGVYFGPEISDEALEIICLILKGQNPYVKMWRGKRSLTEFKIDFTDFSYLTHLEAKELGLR